jgi:hypothetical protein
MKDTAEVDGNVGHWGDMRNVCTILAGQPDGRRKFNSIFELENCIKQNRSCVD